MIVSSRANGTAKGPTRQQGLRHFRRAAPERLRATTFDTINTGMGIFDTPDGCVERIRKIEREFDPGRMICWFNFFGAIPHERVLNSMELFSAKVLPDLSVL
jgi:hypothetical protein